MRFAQFNALHLTPCACVKDLSVARRLIKCLIPSSTVPEDAVIMAVAKFNTSLARPLQVRRRKEPMKNTLGHASLRHF
jgi:hypothetical protein